jgi:hypothetical protein
MEGYINPIEGQGRQAFMKASEPCTPSMEERGTKGQGIMRHIIIPSYLGNNLIIF